MQDFDLQMSESGDEGRASQPSSRSSLPPPAALESGTAPPGKRARTSGSKRVGGAYAAPDGKRWCKAHMCYHPAEEFGGKDGMCRKGKQTYEGAMTQAKNQGEQVCLKQLVNGRPEEFALFLSRFQVEAARWGRGRLFFNIGKFRIYITSKAGMGLQWKAKFMDQWQYYSWAQTVEGGGKTAEEALEQWSQWQQSSDPAATKDYKGKNETLRVAVHVEDYIYGYNEVETGQSFEREQQNNNMTHGGRCSMGGGGFGR